MRGQTKGGSESEFFFFWKKKGPMCVVEGCLGYWCWMATAMAIFASAFNSDNFQVF
jgi:hypothetical protein